MSEDFNIEIGGEKIDPSTVDFVNLTGDVTDDEIFNALGDVSGEFAALSRWMSTQRAASRQGTLADRDAYVAGHGVREDMKTAYRALEEDDIVSGVADMTESLAFNRIQVDTEQADETDIWNQISTDLDLGTRIKEMWREVFTVSQFVAAIYWGNKSYKVQGTTNLGNRRRKSYNNLRVPIGLTLLDPLKVVPIGSFMFGREKLAYAVDKTDAELYLQILNGEKSDPILEQLLVAPIQLSPDKRKELVSDGFDRTVELFELNSDNVWRFTDTRPHYQKYPNIRMRSVFELLDMKRQLRGLERSTLIGSTNYLMLVKKGTDQHPAHPKEVRSLQSQVKTLAKVPVIVGDHRLSVEIVTPKNDKTLEPARHNMIDSRITARLFMILSSGNFAAGTKGDDSIKLARVAARGLESRRQQMRDSLERHILIPTFEANPQFTQRPELRYVPRRVALDFDGTYAAFLRDLRDRGDLSRESILEEVDFNQEVEFRRRKSEAEDGYDDVFQSMSPWGTQGNEGNGGGMSQDPRTAGRNLGGTNNGGGLNNEPRAPRGENEEQ